MISAMTNASETPHGRRLWIALGCLVCLVLVLGTGCAPAGKVDSPAVTFSTPYQAVVLINNSVYYGKLTGWGTSNPVLTDVFYIISKTNPDTKQVSNVLVKRGKELHGPDRMYLNGSQIIFVEPVGADSKVAQLIAEANKQQQ
jgi:small nuclear ribonucleoprotein (snRNP)-like protein